MHRQDTVGELRPQALADVQFSVVSEAGERHFVVAGYEETKLAQAEIRAGLRPSIKDRPTVTVLNLVNELRRANPDLQRAEAFFVAFIGNYNLVRFLTVTNNGTVEIILVHLEKDVVFGVAIVDHPL